MYLVVVFTTRAKKDLRKHNKSGSFPLRKLEQGIEFLRKSQALPLNFQDHALKGPLANYREFHVAQDLLVQYEIDSNEKLITIAKIGTHTELFGK